MIKTLSLILLASAGLGLLRAAERVSSPIPLEEGTQWIYEAKVQWTPAAGEGTPGVKSGQFKWTAAIVESIEGKTTRAAVIYAWPDEAGGMDPAQPTGSSVLLESSNRLYRVRADNKPEARRLARQLAAAPEKLPASAEVYLDLPLAVGKRWGNVADDPKREDAWYCWHVEARKEEPLRIKVVPRTQSAVVFTVAFRTNPSYELFDIAPETASFVSSLNTIGPSHRLTCGWSGSEACPSGRTSKRPTHLHHDCDDEPPE